MNRLLFLSCEHASRAIPRNLSFYFQNPEAQRLLPTHRGYDIGAAEVFRRLAQILQPTYATEGSYSRLAIDLNRNSNKNHRYSAFTSSISPEAKNFLENYFDNYRNAFWETASRELQKQNDTQILHLSIHSFTPVLNGVERNADFGLLYDPSRKTESAFAASMKNHLRENRAEWRIRFNYPYLGKTDGHTTALRKCLPPEKYIGIELEMNQALFQRFDSREIAVFLAAAIQKSYF